jgi:NDP-sugar pyrophosphorylase family protein
MKAIILCAGDGERLKPLTEVIPKPLILINNKPILFYILSSLPNKIDEIFIIIKEKHKNLFKQFLLDFKIGLNIKFLFQDENKKGTYFALMTAKDFLLKEDRFLVLNGDDIFLKEDMENLIKIPTPAYGLSFKKLDKRYRTCDLDTINNKILSFRKQTEFELDKGLPCFSGSFTLMSDFLVYEPVYYEQGEAGIPHTLFANCRDVSYVILKEWLQINTKEDLEIAQNFLG